MLHIYYILKNKELQYYFKNWSIEKLNATKKEYEKSDFFANMFSDQTNKRKKSL